MGTSGNPASGDFVLAPGWAGLADMGVWERARGAEWTWSISY
jgi:hypothetical protein